jgi:LysM repeat protein
MVDNCDKFYKVAKGDTSSVISQKNGISVDEIVAWNPSVGKTCQGLWLDYHVCVSIVGHEPTLTKPTNGVPTPTAIQPEMAAMCNKFHFVLEGESCVQVAQKNGISTADLKLWNGKVGANCEGLWSKTYACVGIIPTYDFDGGHLAGWDTYGNGVSAASKALVVPDSRGYNAVLNAPLSDVVLGVDNGGWRGISRARVPVEMGSSHRLRVMATGGAHPRLRRRHGEA